jgi:hypothetical protein
MEDALNVDYFVAVHAADWPTPAALNRCLTEWHYPIQIAGVPDSERYQPLATSPNTLGLVVTLDGNRVELEASIIRLGPGSGYAYGLRSDLPKRELSAPNGMKIISTELAPNAFVPRDINADLQTLGKMMPVYKDGDYVLTLSFASGALKSEWQSGEYLMAGLIHCANGFGFEFQWPSFGKINFANALVKDALAQRTGK